MSPHLDQPRSSVKQTVSATPNTPSATIWGMLREWADWKWQLIRCRACDLHWRSHVNKKPLNQAFLHHPSQANQMELSIALYKEIWLFGLAGSGTRQVILWEFWWEIRKNSANESCLAAATAGGSVWWILQNTKQSSKTHSRIHR